MVVVATMVVLAACTSDGTTSSTPPSTDPPVETGALYPDVIAVEVTMEQDGRYRFAVTMSSPYDTPQRYADAWRVRALDGTVFGVRELLHDHAGEQPFTRFLSGVGVPPDVTTVVVEGRDSVSGWGGDSIVVDLDG